jgi:hypothetical protein
MHSFLSPSSPAWVNYEEDKLIRVYNEKMTAKRGSDLHAFAADAIRLKIRLPDTGQTLNQYVNDAIGFRMTPEQVLIGSPNCFGTADAIGFDNGILRIFDLKNGITLASMEQLRIYAALFCMEYGPRPNEIELRIYQNDDFKPEKPDPHSIFKIIDRIKMFDRIIEELKREA